MSLTRRYVPYRILSPLRWVAPRCPLRTISNHYSATLAKLAEQCNTVWPIWRIRPHRTVRPTGITVASTAVYTARATLAPPLRARAPSCGLLKDLLAWGGASGASVNWRYDVLEMHARELDRRIRASTERPAMADTASVLSDGVAVHGPDQNAFAHAVGRALGRMCRGGGGGVEERSGACAQRLGGPRHTTGSTVQRFACAASAHVP